MYYTFYLCFYYLFMFVIVFTSSSSPNYSYLILSTVQLIKITQSSKSMKVQKNNRLYCITNSCYGLLISNTLKTNYLTFSLIIFLKAYLGTRRILLNKATWNLLLSILLSYWKNRSFGSTPRKKGLGEQVDSWKEVLCLWEDECTGTTPVKNTSACLSCHSHLAVWETTQRLSVSCTGSDSKYLSSFPKTIHITRWTSRQE